MKTKHHTPKKLMLNELIFGALTQLQKLDYNARSIRRYQSTWKRLLKFSELQKYQGKLREKLLLDFLNYHHISSDELTSSYKGWKRHAEFSLKILWNYSRFGYFERCKTLLSKLDIPKTMLKSLTDYEVFCRDKRFYKPYTLRECVRQVALFLNYLAKRDIKRFSQIQAKDITDFISTLWRFSLKTRSGTVSYIRVYLKHLFCHGKLKTDLSQALPSIKRPGKASIPSVWDKALVEKLLASVDRASPRGKRDYAILLLTARLGLRNAEIISLTLENIDWEKSILSVRQAKTQNVLQLPITDELGKAIIDYLQHARPTTKHRELFLRLRNPIQPFSDATHLYHVVNYWKNLAGIAFRHQQHSGMHSLRHSLATHLLEANTAFPVIASILGHSSMNTTMIYAKTSIERLREVALDFKELGHVN